MPGWIWRTKRLGWLLALPLSLSACALQKPQPEIRYVVQTVQAECPKPPQPPVELTPGPPDGYFLRAVLHDEFGDAGMDET